MNWNEINSDPEFQALSLGKKREVAKGWFSENVSTDVEFQALPKDKKDAVYTNFIGENKLTVPFLARAADFLTGHFSTDPEPKPEIQQVKGGYQINVPESANVPLLQSPEMALAGGAVVGAKTTGSMLQKLLRGSQEAASWASGGVTDVPKLVKTGTELVAKPFVKAAEAKNLAPRMAELRAKGLDVPIDVEAIPVVQSLLEGGTKPGLKTLPEPQRQLPEPEVKQTFYHVSDHPITEWKSEQKVNLTDRPLTEEFGDYVYSGKVDLKRPAPDVEAYRLDQAQKTGKYDGVIVDSTDYQGNPIKLAHVNDPSQLKGLKLESEPKPQNKVEEGLNRTIESAIKRDAMENKGQSILDDIEDANRSAKDVSAEFWDKTYFNLPAEVQQKFKGYVKSLSGMEPGSVAFSDGTKARDWPEIAKFLEEDFPTDITYLEGTERGYVALMEEANKRFGGKTQPKPQVPAEVVKEAEVVAKQPWEMNPIEYVEFKREQTGYYNLSPKQQKQVDINDTSGPRAWQREWLDIQDNAFSEGKTVPLDNRPTWSITAEEMANRSGDTLDNSIKNSHKNLVKQAISEGKLVPPEVLSEYPELAKGSGEAGFISPALMGRIAGGGVGAAVGYKEDTEHPIRGILVGGALGALSVKIGEKLYKSLTEKNFWQDTKRFWDPVSTLPRGYYADPNALEGATDIAMKEASPEGYLDLRGTTKGWVHRVDNLVSRITKNLEKYDDPTRAKISEWMRGDIGLADLPADAQITAKNLRTMQTEVGKMLVKRGRLDPVTFAENKDTYLHNIFAKYLGESPMAGNLGVSTKMKENYLRTRMDAELWKSVNGFGPEAKVMVKDFINDRLPIDQLSPELQGLAGKLKEIDTYRKAIGQVSDIGKEFPISIGQPLKDIGVHDMFKEIADNPYFTWKPKQFKVGKEVFDITSLERELASQESVAKAMPDVPEVQERLTMLREGYDQALLNKAESDIPENFKRFPEGKSYGPLSGQVVRREIVDDIVPIFSGFKGDKALSKIMDTAYNIETKSMAMFKAAKTVFNVPAWVRNFFSNPSQLMMSGLSAYDLPKTAFEAAKHLKNKDEVYGQALRHGLFKSNFGTEEITKILKTFEDVPEGGFYTLLDKIGKIGTVYGKIDDFWKMTKFTEQVNKGKDFSTAAREAQKWVMDYSLMDPAVKEARKHLIPFASYSYKIIPLIAESMRERPWVIPTLFTIPYVLHQASKASLNLTEDEHKKLKRDLPSFIQKSGSYVLVPWKSPEGLAQWVNLDYFFPWGNFKQMESLFRNKEYGNAIQQIGISHPLLSILDVYKDIGGTTPPKDPFTKMPIYNNLDSPAEKTIALAEWSYNLFAPPMLTRFGAMGTMEKAIEAKIDPEMGKDKYGRTVTIPQAALKFGGLNIVAPSPKQAALERAAMSSQAKTDFMNILKNAKTKEKKQAALQNFRERIKEINQ